MTSNQLKLTEILETKRHNQELEKLGGQELAETIRHNVVYEGETNRHNMAFEFETNRHNVEQERLAHEQNVFNYTVGMSQAAASHRMAGAAEAQARIAALRATTDRITSLFSMSNERRKTQNQYEIGMAQVENQRERNKNDLMLGLGNLEVAQGKLQIEADKASASIARDHAATAKDWASTGKTVITTFGEVLDNAAGAIANAGKAAEFIISLFA